MHWKQLLVLLLGCLTGPLESHTSLFVAFLATVTAQLQLGFGHGSSGGSSGSRQAPAAVAGGGAGGDVGAALFGAGLVEELLPDSFLKQAFRGFFEMLDESGAAVPAELLAQVGGRVVLLACVMCVWCGRCGVTYCLQGRDLALVGVYMCVDMWAKNGRQQTRLIHKGQDVYVCRCCLQGRNLALLAWGQQPGLDCGVWPWTA